MNPKFSSGLVVCVATVTTIILLAACGQGVKQTPTLSIVTPQQATSEQPTITWPAGLPEDKLQPWEKLDANGHVMLPKGASNLNFATIFASGIERYLEAGDVTNYGEASSFSSGAPGGGEMSYAIYRLPLLTEQPGTITADVNLHNGSAYFIGVGDYSVNTWHWHGPFSATHVRFNVPDAEYTSGLGNLMLAVVAYDGASFDVVALGANARDVADTEAPLAPAAPTLTPVAGGVLVEWLPVVADDLAGYRIYADGEPVLDYIEGGTSIVVPATSEVEVTLTAVDISGNESELSDPAIGTPLAGEMPLVELAATAASGIRNDSITLTATGGETYDWDLDGDGVWDFTDDPTDTRDADTSNLGVIRPALRAHTSEGGFSLSAISLFITGNFRPVVMATADVTYGMAPLDVEFAIVAEDDDGTIDEYAWDFNGDGTFDDSSPTNPSPLPNTYSSAGMYNAKFRATDNDGAWAVDTVAVQVVPDPDNLTPVITGMGANPATGIPGTTVDFTSAGYDPDGSIVGWEWDFENDGTYDSSEQNPSHQFDIQGFYNVKLRVADNDADTSVGYVGVSIENDPTNLPPVITEVTATPDNGNPPLDVTFTGSASDPDGSITEYAWDWENDGSFDDIIGSGGDAFHSYSASGYYTACFRVTDDDGAATRSYLGINVSYNLPPVAVLGADNTIFHLGETDSAFVSFDASASYDPDGGSLTYYFDPEGDGSYVNNGTDATYDHSYSDNGVYLASLKVEDTDNGCGYNSILITVYRFGSTTLDSSGNVGQYTSLAVVNGHPAVSYYDGSNNDLKYVRANDASGSSWASPQTLDSAGGAGMYTSLCVVNDRPAISYYDGSDDDLMYVRADDASGGSWGTPVVVDSGGVVGTYTSLAVVNGNPAISYYDFSNLDLKYVRANNADGSTWGTPQTPDSGGYVGAYTTLCVVNGKPAISYYDGSNGDLKYVRASDASGSSWGTPVTVDSTDDVGRYTSLAVVDGNPAISYFDDDPNYDLMYVRATDANGDSWGAPVSPNSALNVGYYTSLAVIDGHPAISYRAIANGDLRYVRASDAEGSSWDSYLIPDSHGNVGLHTSLAVVNGKPAISYYDITNADLKFVIPRLD